MAGEITVPRQQAGIVVHPVAAGNDLEARLERGTVERARWRDNDDRITGPKGRECAVGRGLGIGRRVRPLCGRIVRQRRYHLNPRASQSADINPRGL